MTSPYSMCRFIPVWALTPQTSSRHAAVALASCPLCVDVPVPFAIHPETALILWSNRLLQVPTPNDVDHSTAKVAANSQAPVTGVDVNPAAPVRSCCTG
jgi:hypothetical protein